MAGCVMLCSHHRLEIVWGWPIGRRRQTIALSRIFLFGLLARRNSAEEAPRLTEALPSNATHYQHQVHTVLLHAIRHSPPVCGLRQVCNNLKLLRASNTHPNVGYQCTVASEERPEVSRRRITRRPHNTSNSTARCWMTCPYRTQVLHIGDTQHQPNNTLLLSNVAECLDGDIRFEDRHKLGAQGLKPQIACHALFAMEQPSWLIHVHMN